MHNNIQDANVWTTVRTDKFHESRDCAGDVSRRISCSLKEAVEASRWPCRNCVGEEFRAAAKELRGEL